MLAGTKYKITTPGRKRSVLGYHSLELIKRQFAGVRICESEKGHNIWFEYQWIIRILDNPKHFVYECLAEDELFEDLSAHYDVIEEKNDE